jgi:hypothetical protein
MHTEHFLFQFRSNCNQKPRQPGDTMWGHVAKNIQNYYVSIGDCDNSGEEKDWHYKESDFDIKEEMTDFWLNEGEPEVADYWLSDDSVKEWFAENSEPGKVMGMVVMTLTFDADDNATETYNFIHMEIDGVPVEKEV